MALTTSCGVVIVDPARNVFVCRATGKPRWDLPKGLPEAGEPALDAAVREAREEAGLVLEPERLADLGVFAYLPAKRLHLYGLRVGAAAFDLAACRCRSTFIHRTTGRPCPEVNGYGWQPLDDLEGWCGPNLARVLRAVEWPVLEAKPVVARIHVD